MPGGRRRAALTYQAVTGLGPMRFIDAIEKFIYRSKPGLLIGLALAVSFLKTGIWYMPNLEEWSAIALNPFRNPFADPNAHYLFWNWLSPFLAWRLGILDENSFLYFHLAFSILFTLTFLAFVWANFEDRDARTALVLFLALPVSATAYFWVGMDSVTLALMLLLFVVRRHLWLALIVGILLGMQHFEQGAVGFGALTCALLLSFVLKTKSKYSLRWAILSLVGVVLGKLALIVVFNHYHIEVNSGRTYFLRKVYIMYGSFFYYHFQYIAWSVFGVGWIAVAKFAERGKAAVPFLVALAGLLLLLPLVADETRVLAIVSFPLVAAYLLLDADFLRALNGRLVAWIFGLWVMIPWPWAWEGRPLVSIFPYNMAYILHWLFGWFHIHANDPKWPL